MKHNLSDHAYALQAVRHYDAGEALLLYFAPRHRRAAQTVLAAMKAELETIPAKARDPHILPLRYQWWRDAVQEIAEGKTPRAHYVVKLLAAILAMHPFNAADFTDWINSYAVQTLDPHAETALQFIKAKAAPTHIYFRLITKLLETEKEEGKENEEVLTALAAHSALHHFIGRMALNLRAGRSILPQDILQNHEIRLQGLHDEDLPQKTAKAVKDLAAALDELYECPRKHDLHHRYFQAVCKRVKLQKQALQKENYNIFAPRVQQSDPLLALKLLV